MARQDTQGRRSYRGHALVALFAAGAVFASQALAASTFGGLGFPGGHAHVLSIQMGGGGTGTVGIAVFDTALVPSPALACSASNPKSIAFDIATDKGKAALQIFTAALLSGKSVSVLGAGSCSMTSAVETLNQVSVFSN